MRFGLYRKFLFGVFSILFLSAISVGATHLRAGEITVKRVNCQSLTFEITITVYTNTGSSVLFGGLAGEEDILDFGDGTWILVEETPNTPRPDLGPNVGTASRTYTHTYSGNRRYVISYREPNRNEGVLNMDNSVNTRFYIETEINIDPFLGCNNTPNLLIPPIDQACAGVAFFHNPGAYDPDGDSLSYELRIPFSDRNLPVINYKNPNDPKWYTDYNVGNEDKNGPPDFSIDPITGTLVWNSPGDKGIGEYNIAFVVIEWRKVLGAWRKMGFVRRDMQIIVNDCDNERPDLIIPEDVCVEAGTTLEETILGIDPENDNVKIEAFSEIFNFSSDKSPATYTPNPATFASSSPPYELHFKWETECFHVKEQPYQVVFKITDNPGNNKPKLVTFKTWNIKVVGPKPVWQNATLDPNDRSAALDWEDYQCANAEKIQVWRRVDSFAFVPDECQTGMPDSLGYQLIAQVPITSSNYLDTNNGKGLAPGAKYCYRLVAVFPAPKSGESIVSDEICVGPILADAPVITNVTVDKTDQVNGEITIKWREPFDVDAGQFPPPYTYTVLRGTGLVGAPTQVVNNVPTNLLTLTDVGINTEDNPYHYSVICYDNGGGIVDTSAVASSVRLETRSQLKRIDLNWSAFVPWSNLQPQYPRHLIYRGEEDQTEDQFVLIDSVNVIFDGFRYSDEGQWNGIPLEDNKVYCYRVMTRGGYGNPQIGEPLINFSQIICAQPSDTVPPCKVDTPIAVNAPDCDNYTGGCSLSFFENEISWERPNTGECENDVAFYKIYVAATATGEFVPHAVTNETFFVDTNLPYNARCYKVSAVDRSGNEGPLSEMVCIDNCPYYELPNIFTPSDDNLCNKYFSAFSDRSVQGGEESELCSTIPPESRARCARFVENVQLKVFNRWGNQVYSYSSGGERTIYVDWDGRDDSGKELTTGIYYYVADVKFISIDPEKQNQTIKGWVHLLR